MRITAIFINLANYRGDDVLDKGESSDFRAGLAVGAELEYQFTHWLSASFAAMYSQQGVKGRTGGGHVKLKTDYINLGLHRNDVIPASCRASSRSSK